MADRVCLLLLILYLNGRLVQVVNTRTEKRAREIFSDSSSSSAPVASIPKVASGVVKIEPGVVKSDSSSSLAGEPTVQGKNPVMLLNELRPGLQYECVDETQAAGNVKQFTMEVSQLSMSLKQLGFTKHKRSFELIACTNLEA